MHIWLNKLDIIILLQEMSKAILNFNSQDMPIRLLDMGHSCPVSTIRFDTPTILNNVGLVIVVQMKEHLSGNHKVADLSPLSHFFNILRKRFKIASAIFFY